MDAGTLHPHASPYWIDAVIVRLHRNFGALTGGADNLFDRDQAIVNLWDLHLEQALQEFGSRSAQNDARRVVAQLHCRHNGLHRVSFFEEIPWDLVLPWHDHLVVLVVHKQHFTLPNLVHLGGHHLPDALLVLGVQCVLLHVEDAACEILTKGQDVPAAKTLELDFFGQFLAYFKVILHLQGLAQGDFYVFILDFAVLDNFAVAPNFQVPLFRVDDDVKIFI